VSDVTRGRGKGETYLRWDPATRR